MKKRTQPKYALKAFLWGMLIAALFIVPTIIIGKGKYIYYGDFDEQIIPFYQVMSSAIKNGELGWNWYTDLGTSFVGGYSYYSLGSPFFWIMVPFPVEWIPYLLGPLTILKIGCSSLTAYIFLKRYTKDKNNAVIGAMLYAYSGFAVSSLVFHFVEIFVFFPLLLAALDSALYEKKRGVLAFAAAVCAVVNYYFFVGEFIFCLIYVIVRKATKSYKAAARDLLHLLFEVIIGVGLSMFLLLPSMYHIVGNGRLSGSGMTGWKFYVYESFYTYAQIIISFFMPPELANGNVYFSSADTTWRSITAFLPLFSMSGVFAIIFNKHNNKWMRVFYAVCAVFMFVPVLNSSFQLFMEMNYLRWFFMLLLVMAWGSVIALEDLSTKWKKAIIANFVSVIFISVIIGVTPNISVYGAEKSVRFGLTQNYGMFLIFTAVAFLNIALCVLFISLYKKDKKNFKRYCAVITSAAIIVSMAPTFVILKSLSFDDYGMMKTNLINGGDEIHIDDIQQWRTDTVTYVTYTDIMYDADNTSNMSTAQLQNRTQSVLQDIVNKDNAVFTDNANLTMFWRIPGLECFHSTVSGSIQDFFSGVGIPRTTLSNWPLGMYGIRSLLSVKYAVNYSGSDFKITNEEGDTIIPGWKYYDTQNGYDIYENEMVLPMGFTFDNFILNTSFENIPMKYRHLALLNSLVVESIDDTFECVGAGMTQVNSSDFKFTEEEYFQNCSDRISNSCYDFKRDKNGFEAKIDIPDSDSEYKLVFFSVPYDKGWKASVNGKKVDIMKADFGFMAVRVPVDSTSTIRFDYHTPGKFYGMFVAGVCLFLLIIYLAAMKIQSTPDEEEESNNNPSNNAEAQEAEKEENEGSVKPSAEHAADGNEEDLTLFDIVKMTEEENMMHVYKRVPVVLDSGSGAVGYDIDNKRYIDFTSGIGVNALGFVNSAWNEAVDKQLNRVQHTSNVYYNTTQIKLAEKLCEKTGFSKVFFANSGAEANECAIKLARKYGSDKYGKNHTHIVTLENSFHGRTITALSATGQEAFHKYFTPFTKGFSYAKANNMESIRSAVTDDTCAVMIELIQGEGGVKPLDMKFVSELQEFCHERDILLIVDEIQTGVGRTGMLYCYENYGITPDVITSAKALGGGLPLSACMCSEKLKDVMTPGTNGTTFGGNPVACAGAAKIIDIVSDEAFLRDVREKGKYIRKRLKAVKGIEEVRGLGLMIGIVLEKNNADAVQEKCAEEGLLVLTAKNLIRLLPPLNITYSEIDEGLDILQKVIENNNNTSKQ